jgi:hypothetical protein
MLTLYHVIKLRYKQGDSRSAGQCFTSPLTGSEVSAPCLQELVIRMMEFRPQPHNPVSEIRAIFYLFLFQLYLTTLSVVKVAA